MFEKRGRAATHAFFPLVTIHMWRRWDEPGTMQQFQESPAYSCSFPQLRKLQDDVVMAHHHHYHHQVPQTPSLQVITTILTLSPRVVRLFPPTLPLRPCSLTKVMAKVSGIDQLSWLGGFHLANVHNIDQQ